jgi:hypothetical protein
MTTLRRVAATAVALAALTLAGCASGTKTIKDQAATSSTQAATTTESETFPDEGVADTTTPPVRALKVGDSGTLSENDSGQDVARVLVSKVEAIRGEEYNKPERGWFLGVYVKVKALADDQTSLYGDFYIIMRGHHYDPDAYAERWAPTLDYVDLNQGETAEGWLIFDTPARHGQVVLGQSYGGGKIATWSF